ncbi:MAG: NBR1-Ig-like domain-containing protein [Chloroflexota bacterium]
MFGIHKNKIFSTLSILAFIIGACGSTPQLQDDISTAVAQTVQAQNSLTKIANAPTLTPAPPVEIAATAADIPAATNTSAPVVGAPSCTVSASLIGETPPDGTILKPGEYFWKTWTLQNTGTCTWDTSYQLVYWSGDLMDGLVSYPLPEAVPANGQKDIAIYLRAPATEGTFTGYWKLQTPWQTSFGVGGYDEPIYAQVTVSNAKKPAYQITSVDFAVKRDPESGCVTNVNYTLNATISTNGPLEVKYYWTASGSLYTTPKILVFTSAQTQTISYTISINKQSSKPTDYWIQLSIADPAGYDFKKTYVNHQC